MTITVAAVYEGGGVLKLDRPVDLKDQTRVSVTIEASPSAKVGADDEDPTGWKTAEMFIGMWKDAPARTSQALSEEHDRILYGRR